MEEQMKIIIGNEKEIKEIELDFYTDGFEIQVAIYELKAKYDCESEDLTIKSIISNNEEYKADDIDTLLLIPENCVEDCEIEAFAAALTNYHTVERALDALEFFYGKFYSRKDFAKEYLAERKWGGANNLISNNIDFDGVADDLKMEMDFVPHNGSLFVFFQH
jgi:hypothetical protein